MPPSSDVQGGLCELTGKTVVAVESIVSAAEAARLLEMVWAETLRAFFARVPATFAVIDPGCDDPPEIIC